MYCLWRRLIKTYSAHWKIETFRGLAKLVWRVLINKLIFNSQLFIRGKTKCLPQSIPCVSIDISHMYMSNINGCSVLSGIGIFGLWTKYHDKWLRFEIKLWWGRSYWPSLGPALRVCRKCSCTPWNDPFDQNSLLKVQHTPKKILAPALTLFIQFCWPLKIFNGTLLVFIALKGNTFEKWSCVIDKYHFSYFYNLE